MPTATDDAIDDFARAHATCVTTLRLAVDRDWSVRAGCLVWSAAQTAAHLTDVLFSYAFQASAHGTRGVLPFEELHAGPSADAEGLVDGIHASGRMLSAVLRDLPEGAESTWFGRGVGAAEWAAMGARETLLHAYDIAVGLGVDLTPPKGVATRVYEQWHLRRRFGEVGADDADDTDPPDDPWAALVRASERPFGDDEWTAWRAETTQRRSRPAPSGSDAGVLGVFADGTIAAPFGPGWRAFTDERLGGHSTAAIEVRAPGPPGLAHALRITGTVAASDATLTMAGATFLAAERDTLANLSAWEGVRFWLRGAERPFAVWSLNAEGWGGRHVVPLSAEWTPTRLPFPWFGTDGSDLRGLLFAVDSAPGEFWFELGDVRLYSG